MGFGTEIAWPPVPGAKRERAGEYPAVLQKIQKTPYSMTYIGVSFHRRGCKCSNLGTALVKSYSGEFLLPTPETVQAAAASLTPQNTASR